jgi:beta-glucosidase
MQELGLNAYRFSISWCRILPTGTGKINQAGLDFYDRLVDGLLERGMTPYPTLFHYDLPHPLHIQGGWPNRDTAHHFAEYARIVGERLSDRVDRWITHNEPWVTAFLGYLTGEHAPGHRNPLEAFAAAHHVLLSHGYAVQALRQAAGRPIQVGIALNLSPAYPHSPTATDRHAARLSDGWINRWFLDPLLKGHYPQDFAGSPIWKWFERSMNTPRRGAMQPDDFKTIATPLDFVGVNYYSRQVVRYVPIVQMMPVRPKGSDYSEMWEIYPEGLYDLLMRLHRDYGHVNWMVSENGVPVADRLDADGRVRDDRRIRYLSDHLKQVHRAISEGVPISGYLVWSLLDNFEWAHGYTKRFGVIYVDFETKERTIKDSGRWFAQVIRNNGVRV